MDRNRVDRECTETEWLGNGIIEQSGLGEWHRNQSGLGNALETEVDRE